MRLHESEAGGEPAIEAEGAVAQAPPSRGGGSAVGLDAGSIMQLQRAAGNQAVVSFLSAGARVSRLARDEPAPAAGPVCSCGGKGGEGCTCGGHGHGGGSPEGAANAGGPALQAVDSLFDSPAGAKTCTCGAN